MRCGHSAYAKGDGLRVKMRLEQEQPQVRVAVGRMELSARQDWCLEVYEKILPPIEPLLNYLMSPWFFLQTCCATARYKGLSYITTVLTSMCVGGLFS